LDEEEVFVVNAALIIGHLVDIGELDGIFRAGLLAEAAEAAAEDIDLKLHRELLFVGPFPGFDMYAIGRANGGAEHAGSAVLHSVHGLDIVLPPVARRILPALLGILVGDILPEEPLLHRDEHPREDLEKIESLKKPVFAFNEHLDFLLS
jgi:hypothetical protein